MLYNTKASNKQQIVLMYHSINAAACGEAGAGLYSVSQERFNEQLECIILQHRDAIITFDDGHESNYALAYPVLRKLGIKAYFFILVPKVGTPGYMSWEEIREMSDSGMIIGSHGMTHRILTLLTKEELDWEAAESKRIIEEDLGRPAHFFSIPRGFNSFRVEESIFAAGYRAVFTSNPNDRTNFRYGRIAVKGEWDLEYFKRVLAGEVPIREKSRKFIIEASKKVLGARRYDKVREIVLRQQVVGSR